MAGVPRGACVAAHRAAIGRAGLGGGASLSVEGERGGGGGRAAAGGPCPWRAGRCGAAEQGRPEENVQVTLLGVSLRLPGLEEGGQAALELKS